LLNQVVGEFHKHQESNCHIGLVLKMCFVLCDNAKTCITRLLSSFKLEFLPPAKVIFASSWINPYKNDKSFSKFPGPKPLPD